MSIIRAQTGLVIKKNGVLVYVGPGTMNFTGSAVQVTANGDVIEFDCGDTSKDLSSFRQVGTSPLDRYYVAGLIGGEALGSYTVPADTLVVVPHVEQRGGTLDKICVNVTGANANNFRLGLYQSTSDTNLYPSALVEDFGVLSVASTGYKTLAISRALSANSLLWFGLLAFGGPTLSGVPYSSAYPIIGCTESVPTAPGIAFSVAQTYGVLPSTFPASASVISGANMPAFFLHYSA